MMDSAQSGLSRISKKRFLLCMYICECVLQNVFIFGNWLYFHLKFSSVKVG